MLYWVVGGKNLAVRIMRPTFCLEKLIPLLKSTKNYLYLKTKQIQEEFFSSLSRSPEQGDLKGTRIGKYQILISDPNQTTNGRLNGKFMKKSAK